MGGYKNMIHAVWLVLYTSLCIFPFYLPCLQNLSSHFLMFIWEKIVFFIWMLVYVMYKGKWGAKPLDSNGNQADACMQILTNLPGCWSLSLCKYLKATHFKFCDEALQVLSPNPILFFLSTSSSVCRWSCWQSFIKVF